MPSRPLLLHAIALVFCLLGAVRVTAQDAKKLKIPGAFELGKAATLIQELFADDLARLAKEPEHVGPLALRLLDEGRQTRDYAAGRYALLMQARDLATHAGDGATALAAIEELAQSFALAEGAALKMKISALGQASKGATTAAGYQALVDTSLVLLEDALAADDYPSAKELAAAAEGAARKLRNVPLVAAVRKKQDEVGRLEKEFAKWKPFSDKLAKNPDDPEANLEMGKYQALIKGDWEKGLALLAKSSHALGKVAKADLTEPRDGKKQRMLGDDWLAVSATLKDTMQFHALLRAYEWLQQAQGDLGPAERREVQRQLDDIVKKLPPEYQIGEITGELRKCEGNHGPMYSVAFSPDGKRLVACGADGVLHVFDVKSGKEHRRLDGHVGRVWAVGFAPDSRRVLSGGFDMSVRLWDLLSGRETRRLPGHTDYVRSVAISRDGHFGLSGGDDRLLRLWNLNTGLEVRNFPGHEHFVWCVALSRDGKRALSGSLDKTVRLWDVEAGSMLKKLDGHEDTVMSVAFSADGRRAISGSTDKTIKLWDLDAGECSATLTGHKGYVHSVALSPDGRRAISASQDGTVRLWDLTTGNEIRTLEGHSDQVWHVAFSRDGRFAASAGQDGTVRIWGNTK